MANDLAALRTAVFESKDIVARFATLFGEEKKAREFLQHCLVVVGSKPELLSLEQGSLITAIGLCASAGLNFDPNLGYAYIIPRGGRATFMVGYRGYMELAHRAAARAGQLLAFEAGVVYPEDEFVYQYGSESFLRHVPRNSKGGGNITHSWAACRFQDGRYIFRVCPAEEIQRARARSGCSGGPWQTDYCAMAMKTALRRLLKLLAMSGDARGWENVKRVISIEEKAEAEADKNAAPRTTGEAMRQLYLPHKNVASPPPTAEPPPPADAEDLSFPEDNIPKEKSK